jgi:hypothetical protein
MNESNYSRALIPTPFIVTHDRSHCPVLWTTRDTGNVPFTRESYDDVDAVTIVDVDPGEGGDRQLGVIVLNGENVVGNSQ